MAESTGEIKGILSGSATVVGEVTAPTVVDKSIIKQYASCYEFPNQGKVINLYISIADNKAYRWDSTEMKYYCVGSDYDEIEMIYCGKAKEEV